MTIRWLLCVTLALNSLVAEEDLRVLKRQFLDAVGNGSVLLDRASASASLAKLREQGVDVNEWILKLIKDSQPSVNPYRLLECVTSPLSQPAFELAVRMVDAEPTHPEIAYQLNGLLVRDPQLTATHAFILCTAADERARMQARSFPWTRQEIFKFQIGPAELARITRLVERAPAKDSTLFNTISAMSSGSWAVRSNINLTGFISMALTKIRNMDIQVPSNVSADDDLGLSYAFSLEQFAHCYRAQYTSASVPASALSAYARAASASMALPVNDDFHLIASMIICPDAFTNDTLKKISFSSTKAYVVIYSLSTVAQRSGLTKGDRIALQQLQTEARKRISKISEEESISSHPPCDHWATVGKMTEELIAAVDRK